MTPDFDPVLNTNAITVLNARYLIKDASGNVVETPREMFVRVANSVAAPEGVFANDWAETFYTMMASLDFLPNTPCLVNAGRPGGTGQLSACFVLPVPDSIEGIFQAVKEMALVHKTGGGTGFSFSRLRAAGGVVRTTSGVASGPISFMQPFNSATETLKQGGVRRGANMGVLRIDHPDILEFVRMKLDLRKMENFNVSVGVTHEFMRALALGQPYDLVDPRSGLRVGSLSAKDVFDEIVQCAWKVGDPGILFLDRINEADPLVEALGEIEATNPCGEVPLRAHDACTLGSINLSNFVQTEGPAFDYDRLSDVAAQAVRFLDNVLTINEYPIPDITRVVAASRKVGLGVMGWADALVKLGIPYASEHARKLARDVMEEISSAAVAASEELAETRGPFGAWKESSWFKRGFKPRRNATCTVIAPTGSISIIAGCSSGIEPLYALSMTRNQAGHVMTEVNPLVAFVAGMHEFYSDDTMDTVRNTGSVATCSNVPVHWKAVLSVANEINTEAHVRMQAAFQAHVEDGVSKTINMHNSSTPDDVRAAYMLAWDTGCKGITIYRDGCRDKQVLTAGVDSTVASIERVVSALAEPKVDPITTAIERRKIPIDGRRHGITISKAMPYGTVHVTINDHPSDGEPFEVFARVGKGGSEVNAWTEAMGRSVSYLLSIPSSLSPRARMDAIAQQLGDIGGGGALGFGADQTVSAPDAIAKVLLDYLYGGNAATAVPLKSDNVRRDLCPSCGKATLVYEQKCGLCTSCGHSKC